jgi:excisionase family DNA binding protein
MQLADSTPDRPWLSAAEIAAPLGVTPDLILKLARNGDLPSLKLASVVRIPRAAVEELIARNTRPARG